ncbi:hypothetical protein E1I69_07860 [Bacillus timonensis]|uniref:YtkA-like domain-containing protein n=1 Tax=Bacillus timonensis TaxID=1033734 RepID=A0A4S3PU19_9BACI|nr:FixH family protein [Bacillus timonensis]THE13249.1 hypothetical protein E1I69_07860 [Bacillus timonensis]
MKRYLALCFSILLLGLTGCATSNNWEVQVNKPLYYIENKEALFEVQITEESKPVVDLEIDAEFSMANMDHGTYTLTLTEEANGLYGGKIELPMAGDWEIVLNINQNGKKLEKVLSYTVSEAKGVATINGEWITEEDLDFYRFINKLHIAINRVEDEKTKKGQELDEALAHWDSQEKMNDDKNQLITQIIRLRSIAMLGLEKGHTASEDEIKAEINSVRDQYERYEVATNMIKEYGDDKFWETQEKQYKLIVLSQKVQFDVIEKVRKENPNVNEQEMMYLAQKQYEELLVSQVSSLEIELM